MLVGSVAVLSQGDPALRDRSRPQRQDGAVDGIAVQAVAPGRAGPDLEAEWNCRQHCHQGAPSTRFA